MRADLQNVAVGAEICPGSMLSLLENGSMYYILAEDWRFHNLFSTRPVLLDFIVEGENVVQISLKIKWELYFFFLEICETFSYIYF